MPKKSDIQQGWDFASQFAGADFAIQGSDSYVAEVEKAIVRLEHDINHHPYQGLDIAQFKGYIQEIWHAGTFNIDAVAAGSNDRAHVLNSLAKGSVDLIIDSGKDYSAKVYADGGQSAVAQAAIDIKTGEPLYKGQERLVPADQLTDALKEAHRRTITKGATRPDVAESYEETAGKLTDRMTNDGGIESIPVSKKELEEIGRDGKKQTFNAEEHKVSLDIAITSQYVVQQALKAGYTAAAITVAIQLAPEIYKATDYLIKHGEINVLLVKKMGEKAITGSVEGFLRGSISCSILIMCKKGALGAALKSINPTLLGAVVAIVMQTVKSSILVAAGQMTSQQMGAAFVDSVVITTGYIAGAKIGGLIGQALGWQIPVLGYLLGSLVGTSFAVVYSIGKKKLISFCVDTGFACFGLVEQNYELPEDVLKEMGVETIPISRSDISVTDVDRTSTGFQIDKADYETIDITVLRRGIIGVNKIGYVLS